ncbi:MAG: hypothetical protein M3R24_05800 [Chloroflexota bacterium]|nr:hypothetical protein [Chloroflexota bacterium]
MQNYYELLGLAPSAATQDIEAALDAKYNHWRRLATHHDPTVVNQANHELQSLEIIRATLTDSLKRADYDAGLGGTVLVGGLAEQSTVLQSPPPPSPTPSARRPLASTQQRLGLWTCYKCQTDNPAHTKYCLSCASQLVRQCPECNYEASLVASGICGNCGYKYEIARRRGEIRTQLPTLRHELTTAQEALAGAHQDMKQVNGLTADPSGKVALGEALGLTGTVFGCALLFGFFAVGNVVVLSFGIGLLLIGAIILFRSMIAQNKDNVRYRALRRAELEREIASMQGCVDQIQVQVQTLTTELTATTLSNNSLNRY